jgi:hypothetical protein
VDSIIQFIENLVRSVLSALQPLFSGGNLGYLAPFIILMVATLFAAIYRNRVSIGGYVLGWILGMVLIAIYLQVDGDGIMEQVTGNVPRPNIFIPALAGFLVGFLPLLPFYKQPLYASTPIIIAYTTMMALLFLFLTYRAGASMEILSQGVQDLIVYRRRYIGILALAFGTGVLMHIVLSAANPPPKPPPPAAPAGSSGGGGGGS